MLYSNSMQQFRVLFTNILISTSGSCIYLPMMTLKLSCMGAKSWLASLLSMDLPIRQSLLVNLAGLRLWQAD